MIKACFTKRTRIFKADPTCLQQIKMCPRFSLCSPAHVRVVSFIVFLLFLFCWPTHRGTCTVCHVSTPPCVSWHNIDNEGAGLFHGLASPVEKGWIHTQVEIMKQRWMWRLIAENLKTPGSHINAKGSSCWKGFYFSEEHDVRNSNSSGWHCWTHDSHPYINIHQGDQRKCVNNTDGLFTMGRHLTTETKCLTGENKRN